MSLGLFGAARPLLFLMPPEEAHEATLKALELGLHPRCDAPHDPALSVHAFGFDFPNPIGVAAGFDKDARVPDALLAMGCGFSEIGTVTPEPQSGNPKPRVFRLTKRAALINRLGFNNQGHQAAYDRLAQRRDNSQKAAPPGIIAVNIGANKESADRTADYVAGINTFADVASYFVVNISSPNTPGLRDLQSPEALDQLLRAVMGARAAAQDRTSKRLPVVVKIAPDFTAEDLKRTVEVLLANAVDGIAVSNTTLARRDLDAGDARQAGGLSGRPLFEASTIVLARVFQLTGGAVPLIGIGGIDSGSTALEKIKAGASLLQLYTGLVYKGPALITDIKAALAVAVKTNALASVVELTGTSADVWANMAIPD